MGIISKLTGDIDLTKCYPLERFLLNLRSPSAGMGTQSYIPCGGKDIPVRIYYHYDHKYLMIFIHGGGWVTESASSYDKICGSFAKELDCAVVSIDYSLSPEYKFPTALNECYSIVKEFIKHTELTGISPDKIFLCGDSAGGNLCAAVSLMARDRGEYNINSQILLYPVTGCDYSDESPFLSVKEKGTGYSLTAVHMRNYTDMYARGNADRESPYFAPLKAISFENLPRTLLITAENDPLRDEGEEYARKISAAGGSADIHRIIGAEHGFIRDFPASFAAEAFSYMKDFLGFQK